MDFSELWVDKHRPTNLTELDCDEDLTRTLHRLAQTDDLPHIIFYGPSGAGKKTRVMCLLNEIFGPTVYKSTKETYTIKVNSKTIEIPLLSSTCHIDFTPSDAKRNDKMVIQTLLKETATSGSLGIKQQKKNFTSVVLNEAENLTKDAQASLRRTMEKYVDKCRIIMVCENLGNLIPALQSRCLLIRVGAPKQKETQTVLDKISKLESMGDYKEEIRKISQENTNLRSAIFQLQNTALARTGGLKKSEHSQNWEQAIEFMTNTVMRDQSPAA